ncbi:MAG TPA: DUF418 domain-containing protein [Chitinophagaceae bacterium]|nr:DUF418 domain-containing protein [Chitinophagaceae bacterium]
MPSTAITPVTAPERIQTIDIIRGLALFGILLVNFTVDNGNVSPMEGRTGIADQLVYWPVYFFMNDKFLAIFAFLFGLGFAIQLRRRESAGSPIILFYLSRMLVLAVIGTVVAILISARSILFDYALLGLLLLLVHKLSRPLIIILAVLCILVPWIKNTIDARNKELKAKAASTNAIIVDTAVLNRYAGQYVHHGDRKMLITTEGSKLWMTGRSGKKIELIPQSKNAFILKANADQFTFGNDSINIINENETFTATRIKLEKKTGNKPSKITGNHYWQKVANAAEKFWFKITHLSWRFFFFGTFLYAFPLFLLGLYTGKTKKFNVLTHPLSLCNVCRWGLLLGMLGMGLSVGFDAWNYVHHIKSESYNILIQNLIVLSWNIGVILTALAYIAGLALLLQKAKWQQKLSFLIPVGRMGLTNYIMSLIVVDRIFFNTLDDPEYFGPFWRTIFALIAFTIFVFISRWWFQYFRFGPVEWLWRSLSYWKIQPMKLRGEEERK